MPAHALCKTLLALAALAALAPAHPDAASVSASLDARLAGHAGRLAWAQRAPGSDGQAARYIETALASFGYTVMRAEAMLPGRTMQRVEVTLASAHRGAPPARSFIVGAGDTASGAAAVLELARLLKDLHPATGTQLIFVFFIDDCARAAPGAGSFIAFAGTRGAAQQVRSALASFRAPSTFPAEGLAAPAFVEGVTTAGALMITDSALRYPYSLAAQDAQQAPDYAAMAADVASLARLIAALAAPANG